MANNNPSDSPITVGSVPCANGSASKDPDCCKNAGTFIGLDFCSILGVLCILCCEVIPIPCDDTAGQGVPDAIPPLTPVVTPTRPTVTPLPGSNTPSFTGSAFGADIPIVFGSDRLPGNVFWHSGFTQHIIPKADGTNVYYYTTNFAIGICEGEVNAILRMWLGDQLVIDNSASVDANGVMQPSPDGYVFGSTVDLIGADSPLKGANIAKTKITAMNGSRYQLPQGIYISEEGGFDAVPGYRGVCYLLFENYVIYENAVPTITVEVSANTQNLYPRLYGSRPGGSLFDTLGTGLLYDPGYDLYYLSAYHSTTGKRGFISFNGNNLEAVTEHDWITGTTTDTNSVVFTRAWALTSGNIVYDNDDASAAGLTVTANPFADVVIDTNGRFGGFGGHTGDGFSLLSEGSVVMRANGVSNLPVDILCGLSGGPVSANAVGFMEIDNNSGLYMRSYFNGSTGGLYGRLVPVMLGAGLTEDNPTFSDGFTTTCSGVYAFTYNNLEKTSLKIDRYIFAGGGASIIDPIHTTIGTISCALIAGLGVEHQINRAFQDPTDGKFVLMVRTTSGSYFVKWDPFAGDVEYVNQSPNPFPNVPSQGDQTQLLTGQKFGWISGDAKIMTTDLKTGNSTVLVENFGDQDLPTPNYTENCIYNGFENSLTYISTTVGKELTKVFLERYTRNTVTLSEITRQLLSRVGWPDEYVDVNDLQALSVIGYTVHGPKDLRAIFSELKQVFTFDLVESNGKILYKTRGSSALETIDVKYLSDADGDGYLKEVTDTDFAHLRKINLTYRNIDTDYNPDVQSVFLPKYTNALLDNDAAIEVNVPVVLDATSAKKLAEILLYAKLIYQTAYEGMAAPRFQIFDPGDVYNIVDGDDTITIRLRDVTIGQDKSVRFTASREDPDIYNDQVNLFASSGRFSVDTFDEVESRIDPIILPIPFRSKEEAALTNSQHFVFMTFLNSRASSVSSKPATLIIDATTRYTVPALENFPTWGIVTVPPVARTNFYSTDNKSRVRVKMLSTTGAVLNSVTKDELLNDNTINLAYVGGELMQFQNVVDEGGGYYTFTGLHRCRFGTETASVSHAAGEQFILLSDDTGAFDTGSIRRIAIPTTGGPRHVGQIFVQSNNPYQPAPSKIFTCSNLRPRAPMGCRGHYVGNDAYLFWERCSRYNGEYPDDGDFETVPFYDVVEEYTLYLYTNATVFSSTDPATYLRKVTVANTTDYVYTAAMQSADGFDNLTDKLYVQVYASGSARGVDVGAGNRFVVSHKR